MKRILFTLPLLVAIAGCNRSESSAEPGFAESSESAPPPPAAGPAQMVTFAEYQQVKNGMTLQEVEAIVGATGKREGGSRDTNSEGYSWTNDDKSYMIAYFENGKLTEKAAGGGSLK